MCKLALLIVLAFVATVPLVSFAAEVGGLEYIGTTSAADLESETYEPKSLKLGVGLRYFQFSYQEKLDAPAKSNESGRLSGVQVDAEYRFSEEEDASAVQGIYEYAGGKINYSGSLQTLNGDYAGDSNTKSKFRVNDLQARYVHNLAVMSQYRRVDFFLGYGIHRWFRGIQSNTGYDINYSWNYIPFGIRAELVRSGAWRISGEGTAKIIFDGKANAKMSMVNPRISDMTLPLGSGNALKAELVAERQIGDSWSLAFAPWYEQINISRGQWVQTYVDGEPLTNATGERLGAYEPASRTIFYGAAAALTKSF